ncbi:MAG: TonB-dependent receptor [Parvibaculales bacterium]
MPKLMSKSMLALALGFTGTMVSSHAIAQDGRVIDNIIVTAQKKEESLQNVPISISAFDTEALEVRDIQGFEDISEFTPGLFTYPAAANPNGIRISIRGVGTIDPQHGLDSKVALYQDGMYLGKVIGLAFDSPDIARVEVLKGPQGTLYGRNSVAGAINIISAKPSTDEYFGRFQVGFGDNNLRKASGYVNIPMSETAAVRLSASYEDDDGWVENTGPGENFGASERFGYRLSYLNELSDDVELNITADYSMTESSSLYYQVTPITTAGAASVFQNAVTFGTATPAYTRQDTAASSSPLYKGELEQYGFMANLKWDYAEDHSVKFTGGYRMQDGQRNVALLPTSNNGILRQIAAGYNPFVTGANQFLAFFGALPGTTALPVDATPRSDLAAQLASTAATINGAFYTGAGGSKGPDEHEQHSFEATFTGDFMEGQLEYTAGLYYFNEDTATDRRIQGGFSRRDDAQHYLQALAPLGALGGLANAQATTPTALQYGQATGQVSGTSPADQAAAYAVVLAYLNDPAVRGSYTAYATAMNLARNSSAAPIIIETEAMAAYANLTYHVSDALRVTAGLRISDEERDGFQQPVSPFFGDTTTLMGNTIDPNIASVSFDSTDPAITIEYDVNDDVMIYASRSEAFRSGGFNQSSTSVRLTGKTYGEDFLFGPEEITAYELGFKSDLMENRLRVNGAVYFYELVNEQYNIPKSRLLSTDRTIVNSSSDLYGFELDVTALLGDYYTASMNYSYTSGDADPVDNPYLGTTDIREDIRANPEHALSMALDYANELSNGVGVRAHVDYNWKTQQEVSPAIYSDERHVVNANVRFEYPMANGKSSYVSIWSRNLFDESYRIEGLPFETFAYQTAVFGEPRTMGVTVGMNF